MNQITRDIRSVLDFSPRREVALVRAAGPEDRRATAAKKHVTAKIAKGAREGREGPG